MIYAITLLGPVTFLIDRVVASSGSDNSLAANIVAFGVITGLSAAVAKLYANVQSSQKAALEMAERTLPVLGEAISTIRESSQLTQKLMRQIDGSSRGTATTRKRT